MTTNNQTQSWTKITDGGVGKAHFSTYICDFIENKETIIGGKIVFRAGITRLNEVHVYVLSAQSINKDVINSLLMKNMLPFRKDYKKKLLQQPLMELSTRSLFLVIQNQHLKHYSRQIKNLTFLVITQFSVK